MRTQLALAAAALVLTAPAVAHADDTDPCAEVGQECVNYLATQVTIRDNQIVELNARIDGLNDFIDYQAGQLHQATVLWQRNARDAGRLARKVVRLERRNDHLRDVIYRLRHRHR